MRRMGRGFTDVARGVPAICCGACLVAALMLTLPAGSASAAGDVNEAGCSPETEVSPGFRAYLPDCRAYELVSPPYANGAKIGSSVYLSPDGEHLIGNSWGGFAGTENNEELGTVGAAYYELSRTTSGWAGAPLDQPASRFSLGKLVTAGVGLESTLWALSAQAMPEEEVSAADAKRVLALRAATARGPRFTEVGPVNPPSAPAVENFHFDGVSPDLTHVLFTLETMEQKAGWLWPGDETVESLQGGESLYEYVGDSGAEPVYGATSGRAPTLVGVNEQGTLISDCGTLLGGSETSSGGGSNAYNAVSADGETVFFTALAATSGSGEEHCNAAGEGVGPHVNEVYARIVGATTVDISEPPLTTPGRTCTGTCTTNENVVADRSEGIFEGASRDGSKVFFLTKQPLVDGDADTKMDLYEVELEGGAVKRLTQVSHDPNSGEAAEVEGVTRISEDGSRVYFVARGVLASNSNGDPRAGGEFARATPGAENLYVYDTDTGRTTFIAMLCTGNGTSGAVAFEQEALCRSSSSDEALWEAQGSGPAETAPADGRFLVFAGVSDLTSDDASTVPEVFEYDAETGTLARVSIGQNGYDEDGNTTNGEDAASIVHPTYSVDSPAEATSHMSVASNGAVYFLSRDALTRFAVAGVLNVYEYRAGNVYTVSPPENPALQAQALEKNVLTPLIGTDESGANVFLRSAVNLVPQDTNTQLDVYDARELGGFPAPVSPMACVEAACQGSLNSGPSPPAPASATAKAEGDLPSPAKAKAKPLTKARQLANALRACRKKKVKIRRGACEARARKRYGTKLGSDRRSRPGRKQS